jgi:dsRNA-specific ribonuclease
MVKLKKGPTMHGALQNAIVAVINDPNYSFSLPKLSDWESIVSSSADEKQRLEFVGDAVMHLSVALYLYRLFPNAAPGLYTNIRSAVNANATFTHLMVKAGAYKLPSQSHTTKAAADSFEVIVAALYLERGFADVCAWVQEQYAPLIAAARESYDKWFIVFVISIGIPC